MSDAIETGILSSIRFLGWTNFLFFVPSFLAVKGTTESSFLILIGSVSVCFIGTLFYYFLYSRVFKLIDKREALKYFKPYRLGVIVFLFGILAILGLPLIKWV